MPHSQMPDNLQLAWATEEAVDHGGALGNSLVCLRVDMADKRPSCLLKSVLGLGQGPTCSFSGSARRWASMVGSGKDAAERGIASRTCVCCFFDSSGLLRCERQCTHPDRSQHWLCFPCCQSRPAGLTCVLPVLQPLSQTWSRSTFQTLGRTQIRQCYSPCWTKTRRRKHWQKARPVCPYAALCLLCHLSFPLHVGSQQKHM